MNAMQQSLRGFSIALVILWITLCIAGLLYSQAKDIPQWVVFAVVPAFLVELSFYAATGVAAVRARLALLSPRQLAAGMVGSAVLPYLIYSVGTGVFDPASFAMIAGLAAIPALWYIIFGANAWADLAFLVLMAMPVLFHIFEELYTDPIPRLRLHVLGLLMWYRSGILAVLAVRRMEGIGFSFVPRPPEWRIGIRNYLLFLPLGAGLAIAVGFIRPDGFELNLKTLAIALLTFIVTLWVLAAAEEFFFRGLLQQMLTRKLGKPVLAIVVAAVIFGSVHLGYREFPNWRFAMLATCAGLFYGRAYAQAGSVRAAMVTHALVVTTWRVFLS
jgi:membrane protease YdiL (CAAX protease family)